MNDVTKFLTDNPVQYFATTGLDGRPQGAPFSVHDRTRRQAFLLHEQSKRGVQRNNAIPRSGSLRILSIFCLAEALRQGEVLQLQGTEGKDNREQPFGKEHLPRRLQSAV